VTEEECCYGCAENDFDQGYDRCERRTDGAECQGDKNATADDESRREAWELAKYGEEKSDEDGDEGDTDGGEGEREWEIDPTAESGLEVDSSDDGGPHSGSDDGPSGALAGFGAWPDVDPVTSPPIAKLVPAGAEGEAWRGWGWRGFVDGRHFISLSDRFWFLVSRF
jgi:hypothetical protein